MAWRIGRIAHGTYRTRRRPPRPNAESRVPSAQRIRELRQVERPPLNQAMWELIRERAGLTDARSGTDGPRSGPARRPEDGKMGAGASLPHLPPRSNSRHYSASIAANSKSPPGPPVLPRHKWAAALLLLNGRPWTSSGAHLDMWGRRCKITRSPRDFYPFSATGVRNGYRNQVLDAMRHIIDPISAKTLSRSFIKNIQIDEGNVAFTVELRPPPQ